MKNEASNEGGALYIENSDIEFFSVTFYMNKAIDGGAIFLNSLGFF